MTQVHISSSKHTVTVNHDGGDLAYVVEKAQKLWDDTKPVDGPEEPTGPGFGLTSERRWSPHVDAPGLPQPR